MPTEELKYKVTLQDQAARKLGGIHTRTKRLDTAFGKLQRRLVTFGAGFLGGQAILQFGRSTLEALKNYEFFSASLRTLLKGDVAAAGALQTQLIDLAKTTPFTLLDVQKGSKQLLATGSKFGDVTSELRMLGDVAAGVGVPLERIIVNFGQVRAQGRLMGTELRDFTRAGIPLIAELADQFDVAEGAIKDMVRSGDIGFDDVKKAFRSMTAEGGLFFELMIEQSKTVGGRISNLGDSWEQLQVQIGRSQRGIISGTVDFFADLVSGAEESVRVVNKLEDSFKKFGATQLEVNKEQAVKSLFGVFSLFEGEQEKIQTRLLKFQSEIEGKVKRGASAVSVGELIKGQLESELLRLGERFKRDQAENLRLSNLSPRIRARQTIGRGPRLGAEEFSQQRAILKTGILNLAGALKILTSVADLGPGGEDDTTGTVDAVTGVEVSGRRPQNINISIENLVETINIETETQEIALEELEERVSSVLLETLNDANTIAR